MHILGLHLMRKLRLALADVPIFESSGNRPQAVSAIKGREERKGELKSACTWGSIGSHQSTTSLKPLQGMRSLHSDTLTPCVRDPARAGADTSPGEPGGESGRSLALFGDEAGA